MDQAEKEYNIIKYVLFSVRLTNNKNCCVVTLE